MSDIEDMLSVPEAKVDTERALSRLRARVEAERIAPVNQGASGSRGVGVSIWLKRRRADHGQRPERRFQPGGVWNADLDGAAEAV
jgi:hypothetical protein